MNIVELATRRRVTVGMVTLTFVIFGLIALSGLKVNLLPDLSYPTLTVRTEYEGAAPLEIENLISQPVEEAIGVVKNLRKVHSVSRTGQSDVILEFAWGTNMDQAGLDVRDKLDTIQLPLDAKKPVLLRFNPSTDPIIRMALSLSGKGADAIVGEAQLKQLRRFADDELKKRLEPTPGVAAVKVGGGLEDQVDVDIDQQKLRQLNLDIADVAKRLTDENVNVSGGRIENGSQRYLVRTVNQFVDLEQMRNLVIKVDNGVPIRLKDIADVRQGYKEREGIVRIDGHEAIELAIYKEGDGNTVNVAANVKKQLAKLKDILPPNAKLDTIDDQSIFIRSSLDDVRNDAIIGGVLAILIIFFFLADSWSTFIISLSLPISLITTFFFMGQANVSLNVMSLGGLALATGMVVDDSIVVLENIARMREHGASILDASVKGAKEVSMAVIASTLTTVAVFFPLVFVQGVGGQLFRDQALTVTFAMLISLIVAMTLIPMLASLKGRAPLAYKEELPSPGWQPKSAFGRIVQRVVSPVVALLVQKIPRWLAAIGFTIFAAIGKLVGKALCAVGRIVMRPYNAAARGYHAFLPKALAHPWQVLGFAALTFFASLALIPTMGMDLIPQLAQGRFEMTVKLPPGTALADTDALVKELEAGRKNDPNIAFIYGVSGTGTRLDATPTESGENIARLLIVLKEGVGASGERAATTVLRASMQKHPGVEVKFSRPQLFSLATPLEIELRGYDLASLDKAGKRLTSLMNASDRFSDVKSTVEGGYPEIRIRFDQDRAAALGLTTKQIADQVVNKVKGSVPTKYSFRDRKIDVLVRAQENQRGSLEDIRNLIVGYAQCGASTTANSSTGTALNSGSASTSTTGTAASNGSTQSAAKTFTTTTCTPIRLSAVADVISSVGPSEIHRISQERVAIVSANLHYGDLGSAVSEVRKLIRDNPLAAGVTTHIGGQSEELDASTNSLIFALGLAIFLVYLVMASQFESLLHPFVIMFSIPLALVGAVLALKLTGTPISVVVFIGLIMLAGIVVKNAIVLIDRVNQLREEGAEKLLAIEQAAESRLRPITMTTLCTLFGFLPLAIGLGDGAEVRAPMAVTVIGGLTVSTLLTLVVIPVVYNLLDRHGDAYYRERGERKAMAVGVRASETLQEAGT
ncbi:MAG: efflux RND transporter permease subunit [Proteobacteria bacterium]|nr:efflux RND transporter permease subunit [Pseudomonadota bacterium]